MSQHIQPFLTSIFVVYATRVPLCYNFFNVYKLSQLALPYVIIAPTIFIDQLSDEYGDLSLPPRTNQGQTFPRMGSYVHEGFD